MPRSPRSPSPFIQLPPNPLLTPLSFRPVPCLPTRNPLIPSHLLRSISLLLSSRMTNHLEINTTNRIPHKRRIIPRRIVWSGSRLPIIGPTRLHRLVIENANLFRIYISKRITVSPQAPPVNPLSHSTFRNPPPTKEIYKDKTTKTEAHSLWAVKAKCCLLNTSSTVLTSTSSDKMPASQK